MKAKIRIIKKSTSRIIAEGIIEAETIKKHNTELRQRMAKKKRQSVIGLRDYSGVKCPLLRWLYTKVNEIWCVIKIPFSDIYSEGASVELIRVLLSLFLELLKVCAVVFFLSSFVEMLCGICLISIVCPNVNLAFLHILPPISRFIIFYLMTCMIHLVNIEISNTKNTDIITSFFAAITAFISVIFAALAYYKE